MEVFRYLGELFSLAGPLWTCATVGAFIAGAGEKAHPNEGGKHPAALALVAGFASLITPFLLFLHAFWAITPQTPSAADLIVLALAAFSNAVTMILLIVMAVLIIAPALLGLGVAAVAPPLGKLLYWIAPYLNIAVFALAVYATYDNVLAVINAALHRST